MKSFPSSFTKDSLVQPNSLASGNIKQTLKNMAGQVMNNILSGNNGDTEVTKKSIGENIQWDFDIPSDYDFTFNSELDVNFTKMWHGTANEIQNIHENARKIPAVTLAAINKYRFIYLHTAVQLGPKVKDSKTTGQEYYAQGVSPSLFNPWYGVNAKGFVIRNPLMFSESIDYQGNTTDTSGLAQISQSDKDQIAQDAENQAKQQAAERNSAASIDAQIQAQKDRKEKLKSERGDVEKAKTEANKKPTQAPQNKEESNGEKKEENQTKISKAEQDRQNKVAEQKLSDYNAQKQKELDDIDAAIRQCDEEIARLEKLKKNENGEIEKEIEDEGKAARKDVESSFENDKRPQAKLFDNPQTVGGSDADDKLNTIFVNLNNDDYDFTDCSIRTLVNLSNGLDNNGGKLSGKRTMGAATYKYADFMFCKHLGKVSNNHLITLRKFTHPIGDNIFKRATSSSDQFIPDAGRLITWFGTDDNKLEDICKYNYKSTWKEINAEIQDIESKEDNPKLLPSLINMMNPSYNAGVKAGKWGGGNGIYGWIAGKTNFLQAQGSYEGDSALYYRDQRFPWTPKNTIQSNHVYEGKIEFAQEFQLKFSYVLRSYDGINPKSAALDLLGNIFEITARRGKFWGGAHRFLGAPRNNEGWKKANELFDKLDKGLHDGIEALFGCSSLEELGALCSEAFKSLGNFISGAWESAKEYVSSGNLKTDAKKFTHGAADVLQGMLKNKLGRPAIYAMNQIISGGNVGLWHVTIGNPRNPIMSMGNLILTNAEIQHSGVLGLDDFPTELTVTVSLKHARPRDLTAMANMYTCGQGGLLLPLNQKKYSKYFDTNKMPLEFGFASILSDSDNDTKTTVVNSEGKESTVSGANIDINALQAVISNLD